MFIHKGFPELAFVIYVGTNKTDVERQTVCIHSKYTFF